MNEQQVAEAVRDWAGGLLSIPEGQRYAWPIGLKGRLPDLAAVIRETRVAQQDPAFPFSQLRSSWLLIFDVEISVMVAKSDTDADSQAVQEQLQGYGTTLREGALEDTTLAGAVPMTSPLIVTDYSRPPEIDEGQIKGRLVFVTLSVGELIEEP